MPKIEVNHFGNTDPEAPVASVYHPVINQESHWSRALVDTIHDHNLKAGIVPLVSNFNK